MNAQNSIIEPGDDVRVHASGHEGETGTALDVIWYSEQSIMYALVHVMSDEGITHFFDMRMLEKVRRQLDKDLTSEGSTRTWNHVK